MELTTSEGSIFPMKAEFVMEKVVFVVQVKNDLSNLLSASTWPGSPNQTRISDLCPLLLVSPVSSAVCIWGVYI